MEYFVFGEVFVLDEEEICIIQIEVEGIGFENVFNVFYSKLKKFIELVDGFMNNSYGVIFLFQLYISIDEMIYCYIFMFVLMNK